MAQKTRAQIVTEITTLLADNTTGDISAEDVRSVLTDIKDSFVNLDDDDSDDITEGVVKLFLTVAERSKLTNVPSDTNTELAGKQDVVAGVSDTEISYLDGVTSAIQTQLDGKVNDTGDTVTGFLRFTNGFGVTLNDTLGNPQIGVAISSDIVLLSDNDLDTTIRGGSIIIDGNTTINGNIDANSNDIVNIDQITQSHSASGNGVSFTHSGTGNALVITKTNSGEAIDVVSGTVKIQSLTASRYLFIDSNNRITTKTTAEILTETGAITEIVQDTTPQLGGNLDAQSNNITNVDNIIAESFVNVVQELSSSAGAVGFAARNGNYATLTLTENTTMTLDGLSGEEIILEVIQDTTTRTLTFSGVEWPSGIAPTITAASGAKDVFKFIFLNETIYGQVIGQNFG